MDRFDARSFLLGVIPGFFIAMCFALFVTEPKQRDLIRRQAIAAEVARWTINEQTGKRKFEFIKCEELK